jgi:hypothetical protein
VPEYSFDEVMVSAVAEDSADALLPTSSLGKCKYKSPSETNAFTRAMHGAKDIALAKTVLLTETKEVLPVDPPVDITSPV